MRLTFKFKCVRFVCNAAAEFAWGLDFFLRFPNKVSCLDQEVESFHLQYTCNDYKLFEKGVLVLALEYMFSALGSLPVSLLRQWR